MWTLSPATLPPPNVAASFSGALAPDNLVDPSEVVVPVPSAMSQHDFQALDQVVHQYVMSGVSFRLVSVSQPAAPQQSVSVVDTGVSRHMSNLTRPLYGLRQAPRTWVQQLQDSGSDALFESSPALLATCGPHWPYAASPVFSHTSTHVSTSLFNRSGVYC